VKQPGHAVEELVLSFVIAHAGPMKFDSMHASAGPCRCGITHSDAPVARHFQHNNWGQIGRFDFRAKRQAWALPACSVKVRAVPSAEDIPWENH
jgi:hypothetical protein